MSISLTDFRGPRRKLVLSFDVGTTYSSISYSLLIPGEVPEICAVTRFPGQEYASGLLAIPTIIYYDRTGKARAIGAEAMKDDICMAAEDEDWVKAEWFKLHLRSRVGAGRQVTDVIHPLPLNKTVVEVFADFLAYLLECASNYIQERHLNGTDLWMSVKDHIDFILPHPNGWESTQQAQMREAAVLANLVPDNTDGHARLSFVTEGEAILHFSMQNGLPIGAMKDGEGVVIVDAGRSTIEIGWYIKKIRGARDTFEEVAAPQCHFCGSVFVSMRARNFLQDYLQESDFLQDLDYIVDCFDKTTKLKFRNSDEPQFIRFGRTRDNDPTCNIQFGLLKLLGSDVATFFEPSAECILKAVLDQQKEAQKPMSYVILVGEFATSDWLFHKVYETLLLHGINTIRPESHSNNAMPDGAISFHYDNMINTRVSNVTYGIFCHIPFDPAALDHQSRLHNTFTSTSGLRRIKDSFEIILPKDTQVWETKEFRKDFFRESQSKHDFKVSSFSLWCYRGAVATPKWKDVDTQNYTKLCTIEVDLSRLPLSPRPKYCGRGSFYRLDYDIILLFGLTELKAMIAWKQDGVEWQSEAKIIYDQDTINDGPYY